MVNYSWSGTWQSNTYYEVNTFVKYGNIAYVSTNSFQGSTTPPPNDMLNWNVFVIGYQPPICYVQSGLRLYVDASKSISYPTTGNTWNNLVGSENITLLNGPTFVTSNGGSIHFDNLSSQYGTFPNLGRLSAFTVSVWYNMQTLPTPGAYYPALVSDAITSLNINYVIGSTNFGNNQLMAGGFHDGAWRVTTGFPIVAGEWVYVTLTYDGNELKLYKNDSLYSSNVVGASAQTDGAVGYVNKRWDYPNYYDVDIPVIQIYDRELSLSEIQQNYNCFSGRYI